jgi:hypothetical protein
MVTAFAMSQSSQNWTVAIVNLIRGSDAVAIAGLIPRIEEFSPESKSSESMNLF